jgi:hypothetical protein
MELILWWAKRLSAFERSEGQILPDDHNSVRRDQAIDLDAVGNCERIRFEVALH